MENAESVPLLQKEQSISSGFENPQLGHPSKIWIKYGDSRPVRLAFDGEIVDELKKEIKKELSPDLDDVAVNRITLRRHGEEEDLRPGLPVDESFKNDDESPLQVIVNASVTSKRKREESEDLGVIVENAVEKALTHQKPADIIKASSLSETKANNIIDCYGLKSLKVCILLYYLMIFIIYYFIHY
ncbi:hypothetical protein Glove_407g4 [Diversispora epigaea]|uniref:Uncharacterized protein n=1 Tax=Diversispora epigaea TaxID=1348612 RepID=A0A397H6D6_9GLOM|nr:hypothetical protein Glove_407g4 [Diversispora epigaea]